jgi:hypothetical protein
MSGLAGLLKHGGRSKASKSHENTENIYSKVLKRNLPLENEMIFDQELKLFLMDGLVFPLFTPFLIQEVHSPIQPCQRIYYLYLAGHGTPGA